MLELIVGWLFWTIKHANKWLFTSNCHFNATFRPSRASSGIQAVCLTKRNVALKWQLEVKSHLLACLIVQNNHPTINSSMPNNLQAVCLTKPVMGETLHWSDNWKWRVICWRAWSSKIIILLIAVTAVKSWVARETHAENVFVNASWHEMFR